jgi:hypothetical protein
MILWTVDWDSRHCCSNVMVKSCCRLKEIYT